LLAHEGVEFEKGFFEGVEGWPIAAKFAGGGNLPAAPKE
jgi:hypothetical protein